MHAQEKKFVIISPIILIESKELKELENIKIVLLKNLRIYLIIVICVNESSFRI